MLAGRRGPDRLCRQVVTVPASVLRQVIAQHDDFRWEEGSLLKQVVEQAEAESTVLLIGRQELFLDLAHCRPDRKGSYGDAQPAPVKRQ